VKGRNDANLSERGPTPYLEWRFSEFLLLPTPCEVSLILRNPPRTYLNFRIPYGKFATKLTFCVVTNGVLLVKSLIKSPCKISLRKILFSSDRNDNGTNIRKAQH
jgi:hypothetical protein